MFSQSCLIWYPARLSSPGMGVAIPRRRCSRPTSSTLIMPAASTVQQIRHVNALFTVNTYTHASEHAERLSGKALEEHKKAIEWAGMGSNGSNNPKLASELATENAG